MGTLGVIAQLTLKVRPRPEASAFAWATFPDAGRLASALGGLNTSGTRPIAVEALNAPAAGHVGGPLGLAAGAYVLAVGFEDNAASVRWQLDRIKEELAREDVAILEGDETRPLWSALTEFQASDVGRLTVMANLRPSTVPSFLDRLDSGRWAAQAHAGNGIVRAHWRGGDDLGPVEREVNLLRSLAVGDGGNLVLSKCPAGWKTNLKVWGERRPDWALAERVKAALDPRGVMNPGRFVGRI
jgi:glycolate oxidase FAD binding subunit